MDHTCLISLETCWSKPFCGFRDAASLVFYQIFLSLSISKFSQLLIGIFPPIILLLFLLTAFFTDSFRYLTTVFTALLSQWLNKFFSLAMQVTFCIFCNHSILFSAFASWLCLNSMPQAWILFFSLGDKGQRESSGLGLVFYIPWTQCVIRMTFVFFHFCLVFTLWSSVALSSSSKVLLFN